MISERDESRPYAIRVVHSPVDAERDESNHAHIVLILLQSYHTNTDRMYHICKKLYHICNFQRNLLENVRDMYTLRQIGINIYQKTDLRQPYGRDASRSAYRVQYIAGGWAWLRLLFLFGSSFIMVLLRRNVMNHAHTRQCLSPHRLVFQSLPV